jgi:hypothetical protein
MLGIPVDAGMRDRPAGRRVLCLGYLAAQPNGLIVMGSETDVCVLATIMGAVDHGYRIILVLDGGYVRSSRLQ